MKGCLRLLLALNILMAVIGTEIMRKRLRATEKRLQAAIQSSNQCTSREQCAHEDYGDDPCGGSSGTIIYSTVDVNSVRKIKRLAKQIGPLQAQINREDRKNGVPQICTAKWLPSVGCSDGKCVGIYEHK